MPLPLRQVMLLMITVVSTAAAQQAGGVLPTAVAFPERYFGNCPADIQFIGHITVTVPGTRLDYQWERSDGKTSKVFHVQVGTPRLPGAPPDTSANPRTTGPVPVVHWHVAFPGRGGQYWQVLHVLVPYDIRSEQAMVDVDCRTT